MAQAGPWAIALDVGGTKVAASLVDQTGRVRGRLQQGTEPAGGEAVVQQVIGLARRLARSGGVAGVGVAVPAVVDPRRREVVWAPNIRGWRRLALSDRLEAVLDLPTWLEYDGHAAVLGEHWAGAGRGVRNLVMVMVGTGIGGGMILDGQLYRGRDGLAGAAGWLTSGACVGSAPPGQPALEREAAGPALAHQAGVTSGRAEDVVRAAAEGDGPSSRALDAVADRLGLAVADVVSLLNPDVVVLGGGVCAARAPSARLLPGVRRAVRRHAQPVAARHVRVVRSRLGANAGLVGAACSVFQELRSQGRMN